MIRMFDIGRKSVQELNSWRMTPDFNGVGKAEEWYKTPPADLRLATVPSCWNLELDLFTYTGDVWYFTDFVAETDNVRLVFGAVNNECDVWVDGDLVASHYGAFMEFAVELPHLGAGKHTLTVRVSAYHNLEDTIPLERVDWYNWGGLIRAVELHGFGEAAIVRYRVYYELDVAARAADVRAEITLSAFGGSVTDTLTFSLGGKSVSKTVTVTGEEKFTLELGRLEDLKLWDIFEGNLYMAEVTFAGDCLRERIGFREFCTEGRNLMLNGRRVELRGVNRHEDHPVTGFAMAPAMIKRDLDIIRKTGCNMVRGSHYPNSKLTLDLLDEMGFLFWEEIPMWGFDPAALARPRVHERAVAMHHEMIARDFNHPAIVIWGMENEANTGCDASPELLKLLYATVKGLDSTRVVTYACNRPQDDICMEYCDMISINVYPVWYGNILNGGSPSEPEIWPAFIDKFEQRLISRGLNEKPLVISEFGVGGIPGNNDPFAPVRWTEEYQEDYYRRALPLIMKHRRTAGTIIWQYCDTRSAILKLMALQRPRSFNNKGLLSEYRVPKRAWYVVKELYENALRDGIPADKEN